LSFSRRYRAKPISQIHVNRGDAKCRRVGEEKKNRDPTKGEHRGERAVGVRTSRTSLLRDRVAQCERLAKRIDSQYKVGLRMTGTSRAEQRRQYGSTAWGKIARLVRFRSQQFPLVRQTVGNRGGQISHKGGRDAQIVRRTTGT